MSAEVVAPTTASALEADQVKGGLASMPMERRPAQRQMRAERSRSSSVTRLPIQRSASVMSQSLRMPTGPSAAIVRGTVKTPARRRAMENASP